MERTDAFDKIFKAIMSEGQQENPLVTTFLHLSEGELIKRRGEEADEAAESERKRLLETEEAKRVEALEEERLRSQSQLDVEAAKAAEAREARAAARVAKAAEAQAAALAAQAAQAKLEAEQEEMVQDMVKDLELGTPPLTASESPSIGAEEAPLVPDKPDNFFDGKKKKKKKKKKQDGLEVESPLMSPSPSGPTSPSSAGYRTAPEGSVSLEREGMDHIDLTGAEVDKISGEEDDDEEKALKDFNVVKGMWVLYDARNQGQVLAQVLKVHADDPEDLYFTIKCVGVGEVERQTVESRLVPAPLDMIPPEPMSDKESGARPAVSGTKRLPIIPANGDSGEACHICPIC